MKVVYRIIEKERKGGGSYRLRGEIFFTSRKKAVDYAMDREEELTYEVLITHVAHPNTEWQCWYGEDCVRHFYENELFASEESLKKNGERSFLETKVVVARKILDTLETALLENEKKFEELPHAIDGLHRAVEAQRKELKELRARSAELDESAAKKKRK